MEDKIFLCELTLLSLHLFPDKKQLRFGLIVKKKNSSLIFLCVCVCLQTFPLTTENCWYSKEKLCRHLVVHMLNDHMPYTFNTSNTCM